MNFKEIYNNLVPQMRDVEGQGYQWRPYFMRQGKGSYRSVSMNTDRHGFRLSDSPVLGKVSIDDLWRWKGFRGVVLGNSMTYGVGVTSDGATLASLWNRWNEDEWLWVNLSLRASVLWQERQILELYLTKYVDRVVWISGVNDLISIGISDYFDKYIPPFIGEPHFVGKMNEGFNPDASYCVVSLEERLSVFMDRLALFLYPLAWMAKKGVDVTFVLQPLFTWLKKKPSKEEEFLISYFDMQPSRLHRCHGESWLRSVYGSFSRKLSSCCDELGIRYWDANESDFFRDDAWLFVDRVHLNDRGHYRLAKEVMKKIK